jgi:hypothetical protein
MRISIETVGYFYSPLSVLDPLKFQLEKFSLGKNAAAYRRYA